MMKTALPDPAPKNALASRLIVALDTDTRAQALDWVAALAPLGVTFKLGMQLYYREGMPLVQELQAQGARLFVDLKLHDIPNTVAQASAALVSQGVRFFNVHTQGGPAMMRAAVDAARAACPEAERDDLVVLGVTLLTSLTDTDLNQALKVPMSSAAYVPHLAQLAQEAGLTGVVCSPQEVAALRAALGPEFRLVTPGVRPVGSDRNDQARTLTPGEALRAGTTDLVVGRPITAAPDPVAAAQAILADMAASTAP